MSVRKRNPLNAPREGGFESLGADSRVELTRNADDGTSDWMKWIRISGKHETVTWDVLLFSMFMEAAGSCLLGMAVALSKWASAGTSFLENGAFIGLAYGATYYVLTRWVNDYVLRRHLSGAISMGYFLTNDIGLLGLFAYATAQYCGGILGGAGIIGLLSGRIDALPRSVVPIPLTTSSSLSIVICLELFCAAIVVFSLLINEFLNTKTAGMPGDPHYSLKKNYKNATGIAAATIGFLVLIFYQFQVFTFNNVAYFAGLFGGIGAPPTRDINNVFWLNNVGIFTDSVFAGNNCAGALYLFMPYAGGVLGAALFYLIFFLRADKEGHSARYLKEKAEMLERADADAQRRAKSVPLATTNSQAMSDPFGRV
jgi:glycerol uptake facilitator-like aquaporin